MRRMRHMKPREVQGCAIALDASIASSLYDATSGGSLVAADGEVLRWEDQSGNARHVTQSASGVRPRRRIGAVNGVDSLEFDGNDSLEIAGQNLSNYMGTGKNVTLMMVLLQSSTNVNNVQFSIAVSSSNILQAAYAFGGIMYFDSGSTAGSGRLSVAQPAGWTDATHVTMSYRSDANATITTDNVQRVSSTALSATVSGSSTLFVGRGSLGADYHKGQLPEIAVWPVGLSDFVRRRISHSRQRKWRVRG